ncbi:hypothetical protein B0T25DRAFT_542797 [Lasiosphaeria hispida]|uniref:Uncharacterized protein n=1 Tax=Lasiosphaeria hispida TaxID=260671 RepID=A0AAJ0HHI8_9PEZI|nr:hypothetical protein B0T25DRAFT_542797 [Lasiosphaeria hispida]
MLGPSPIRFWLVRRGGIPETGNILFVIYYGDIWCFLCFFGGTETELWLGHGSFPQQQSSRSAPKASSADLEEGGDRKMCLLTVRCGAEEEESGTRCLSADAGPRLGGVCLRPDLTNRLPVTKRSCTRPRSTQQAAYRLWARAVRGLWRE